MNRLCSILFVFLTVTLASCAEDNVDDDDKVLDLLTSGRWIIDRVTVDGVEVESLFHDMTLQFSNDETYASQNGGLVWRDVGTYQLINSGEIALDGDLLIAVRSITENQLILSLFWNEEALGTGRVRSISGEHVFMFIH